MSNLVGSIDQQVKQEVDRNRTQESTVGEMLAVNNRLLDQGARLPSMVEGLDQFLEPLERAREAVSHNHLVRVAVENLTRNVRSVHRSLVKSVGQTHAAPVVRSVEQFVDQFSKGLVEGREVTVESWLERLLQQQVEPITCLDAVGKAVQAANMLQKHRHVSVGDYYLNYLAVERALQHLTPHLESTTSTGMKVVLGNARGDYHSLGREMVGLFLKASGIEVIDVGVGAEVEKFVAAVQRSGAKVVGVSSLLVESAKEITKIREQLDKLGKKDTKIVAGGACFVVDREFAAEVKADYVATAASDMVSIVQRVYQYAAE